MQGSQGPPSAVLPNPKGPPVSTPFFYGWIIVACVAMAGFLSSGTTNVVASVLLKPMAEETGWSRTMISSALGVGAIAAGVLSPLAGLLVDRFGGRMLVPIGGVISGVLYILTGQATIFSLFLVSFAANRAVAWAIMSGVAAQATVTSWFRARRPRALGMVGMVTALGGSAMAVVAQFLLEHLGWRGVMTVYGGLTLLFVVGPSALLIRSRPEDVGLTPDGFLPEQAAMVGTGRDKRRERKGEEYSWSLSQAIHTPAMWLITASGSVALFGVTGVSVHQVAYLTDQGIPAGVAASVLVVYTFSSAISSFVWGLLTERFDERSMSVGALATAAIAIWFLTTVNTVPEAFIFAAVFGMCARGQNTLVSIVFAQYFGRGSFGAISGLSTLFQTFAAAVGLIVAALAFDAAGTYLGVFYALIGVFALASFLMFLARRPVPPISRISA